MRFIALLITFVISAAWITTTGIHYGTVYRVEHEKMLMEFLTKHHDPTHPPGRGIPGGVEIPGATFGNL